MKRLMCIVTMAALTVFAFAGCNGGTSGEKADNVKGSIAVNGSTSMESVIGILSEKFMQDNKGIKISYDATGSGTGIAAVSKGSCDIGLASRSLKDAEKASGLEETTIALDGIAIIVNEKCPVDDMTLENIKALFNGSIKDWAKITGESGTVAAIGREAGSGTRDGFESITKTKDKCKLAQELTSTGAVIEAIKNNKAAIGYASFASVENRKGIKVLKINGVACNEKNIADGSYVIQRPLNLVTKKGTKLSECANKFYTFMTSKEAAPLILKAGAVPTAK